MVGAQICKLQGNLPCCSEDEDELSKKTALPSLAQHVLSLTDVLTPQLKHEPQPSTIAMAPKQQQQRDSVGFRVPIVYRHFFLNLEPISALAGAFYNQFRQARYLQLLDAASAPDTDVSVPLSTSVAMSQLANMYLFFALNEAIVLRSTADLRVWRAVLLVLLLADFGHLWSMRALGGRVYWDAAAWNAGDLGNVPWVYAGATMRMCFLAGVGLDQ